MKPSVVVELLRDPSRVARRLVRLRDKLPHANVSLLAANLPDVLLQVSHAFIESSIESLSSLSFGLLCPVLLFLLLD